VARWLAFRALKIVMLPLLGPAEREDPGSVARMHTLSGPSSASRTIAGTERGEAFGAFNQAASGSRL
jgi:hypothetical protein